MSQKGFSKLILILGIILLAGAIGGTYYLGRQKSQPPIVITPSPPPTQIPQIYTCPENGWENCMPILSEEGKKQCSKEALEWKKANCPNFQGAAY